MEAPGDGLLAELFSRDLANEAESFFTIFDESDVDSKLKILDDVLLPVLNLHAPMKSIKIRSRSCTFVNQEIRELMKSRDLLLKQFLWTRQDTDWQNFKESRIRVKKILLEAERKHTFVEVRLHKNNLALFGRSRQRKSSLYQKPVSCSQ